MSAASSPIPPKVVCSWCGGRKLIEITYTAVLYDGPEGRETASFTEDLDCLTCVPDSPDWRVTH